MSSSGGRVVCIGNGDGMLMGDWLCGLELWLCLGVVGLDGAGMPRHAFNTEHKNTTATEIR
jgi:hypothetical protein